MTHKTTITDNYILITSDGNIDNYWYYIGESDVVKNTLPQSWFDKLHDKENYKNVIAHLPLNNSPILEGVPLLPPLPSGEDDVEKLSWEYTFNKFGEVDDFYDTQEGYIEGWKKHSEKYRFTEEDMVQAFAYGRTLEPFDSFEHFILSLSQPKMPTSFSPNMVCDQCNGDESTNSCYCHYGSYKIVPQIINGVMQGEWIY